MDEQRLQAYYQLIQQLLSCSNGEKAAILQANRELLDVGFLQVVVGVAETFTQQEEENTANWLLALASQLSEELDIALTPEPETPINEADFDTYLQFLSEVLQATAESEYNPQVVYPLLAANTDKLNLTFVRLLQVGVTKKLQEAEPNTARDIAVVIGNFSNLIQQFPLGNKADNMEIAITGYEIAFTVFTRTDFPEDWAMTQNNLGNAYSDRISGDKAENLENAIAAFNAALEVYNRTDFPVDWATTQNNLGNAYSDRIRGDKAENLENAIAAYNKALKVRTRTDFPEKWAMTQNNLGNAYLYLNRIRGDKADNLEIAIAAYNNALKVYTRTAFPKEWATTQNNLGTAYSDRIRGDKADNLEIAIAAYNNALKVRTPTDFPVENAQTLFNLGIAYQDSQQFDLAYDTFKSAIATVEGLRAEIISGEESKRKQAEEWNKLFVLMVEVCLVLGKEREAISYIERSKTRNLVELIAEKVDFTPIEYSEIQNLLDEKTAIIQFYIFNACFRAFIITKNNDKPIIWKSTEEDLDQFRDWINKYLTLYYSDRNKWRNDLNYQLTKLAEIFHINQIIAQVPKHIQKIIIIPHRYLHLLPFHAIPLSTNSEYLFDKYPGGVSYAPSCQLLNIAKERLSNPILQRERTRLSNLFAIQDPNNNLRFTNIEVETIAASFDPQQILKNNEASKANLQETTTFNKFTNSQWLHFSCHGSFDLESPLKSALQLVDSEVNPSLLTTSSSGYARINEETAIDLSKCLTLAEILELNLPQCYLVCLSACETGVIDFKNNSDEFIGLSSGFIKAGAVNIVSSLWTVNDFQTAILMIKLYENIANNPQDITLALNTAQEWLRKATQVQIIDWLKQKTKMKEEQKQEIINLLSTEYKPEHQPFNKPYFWAGFCAVSPVISPV
ncbi:CHAT domain-containing protein [Dolichospermum sp. FACHB-1091]|uniref:CHAT domain-containing protein n=1 Tax=Dolichospermum sp. FACHB-1091 TaxID=2692798 RepID=UPI001681BF86|nr:CHAT domain-containing protein [Dolichospermum sp. FACHB-1091]MBD2441666.1 CHAT domain-containing protein [Dolichospermum sp. FACHB-1091]